MSFFLLLLSFALYDTLVKGAEEFPVNLVVFFYCSVYLFILYTIWLVYQETKDFLTRIVLGVLMAPFVLRIGLNLVALVGSRNQYNQLVSNKYLDIASWLILIAVLITVLCANYIVLRRR